MGDHFEIRIVPDASPEDHQAILAAVRHALDREATLSRPSAWRLAGWLHQRVGITDVSRWVPASRLWPASANTPWGGRAFAGLVGRGDAR